MKRKIIWLVVSWLMVLALLVTACAKKTEETAPAVKEAAPVVKEAAPAVKEAAPVVKAAATTEAPRYGGILLLGLTANPTSFDPALLHSGGTTSGGSLEGLALGDWAKGPAGGFGSNEDLADWTVSLQYTPAEVAIGVLAESWDFPDDQTITYHIRKGVHWALNPNKTPASQLVGGRELVADDVVFSLQRVFWDPKTPQWATVGSSRPTEIYASDKYTVVVKVPPGQLGMAFLNMNFQARITAPEIAKKYGNYQAWENMVGTGPFILTDHVPMSSLTSVRNPNYYLTDPIGPGKGNQLPYVDTIKQLIIPDQSTRMAALRTGKIDQDNTSYTAEDARQLIKTNSRLKYMKNLSSYLIVGMRQDGYKPGLPWAGSVPYLPTNPSAADTNAHKVRRALNLATNNQAICDALFGGEGELVTYKVAPVKMYRDVYTPPAQLPAESRELFEYNLDKAKQLMIEAGYPNGFKVHANVTTTTSWHPDYAQMLKAYWAKIGVDLELKVFDMGAYRTLLATQSYDEIQFAGRISYGNHMMYSCKFTDQWNTSRLNDPKLEDYYNRFASAANFDTPKLNRILKELNLYVIPKAYLVYTPTPFIYIFWQPWLKNYSGEVTLGQCRGDGQWMYVWIDQELRKSMAGR